MEKGQQEWIPAALKLTNPFLQRKHFLPRALRKTSNTAVIGISSHIRITLELPKPPFLEPHPESFKFSGIELRLIKACSGNFNMQSGLSPIGLKQQNHLEDFKKYKLLGHIPGFLVLDLAEGSGFAFLTSSQLMPVFLARQSHFKK
jgi:hypothetical protein